MSDNDNIKTIEPFDDVAPGTAVISSEDPGTILNPENVETTIAPRDVEGMLEEGETPAGATATPISTDDLTPADEIVVADPDTMTLINTLTGEVVGWAETPPDQADDIAYATWLGERRANLKAKIEGKKAERQWHLDRIAAIYDADIRKLENSVTWIEKSNEFFLFNLAKKLIGEGKKRSAAVGMLILKLTKTRAKVDITDEETAIGWLKTQIRAAKNDLLDANDAFDTEETEENKARIKEAEEALLKWQSALKRTTSILKSNLPNPDFFTEDKAEETGIVFDAGGKDQLKIE